MRHLLFLVVPLVLTACAPTLTGANSQGGMIRLGGSLHKYEDALALADAQCAKDGRVARVTSQNLVQIAYECVTRPA